ncbi:MAG: type III pantothenate kinase [Lachnospiraceae bacterium]|nr:type III pantothenate kinase [Lachnospiraceae bacterium]
MLLVIDVGNTHITLGLFDGEELTSTFRMTTKQPRTSDEYGMLMMNMFISKGVDTSHIKNVIISSVVPDIMYSLINGVMKYFGIQPLTVGPGIKTGIRIMITNPKEVGADRIVDALAAYELYGGPVLVVDFGTATTYDLVNSQGDLLGGVTSPGLEISAKALWQEAAKLPKIEIRRPESIIAKDTITSMQAGLVYGYIGQTEYIIKKMREESGFEDLKVVATGGLGRVIAEATDAIQIYDNKLTLKGLRIMYEKNKRG